MPDALKLFIPITKIDAAKRLVYGVATAEKPDVSKEICDYASTKPLYQKWSENFSKVTEGKSLGNLRAMHGNVAAGKLIELAFNDDEKQIEICGKVVDDGEWAKVEEGVYTGFSQGGRYIKRWPDPDDAKLTRYTAEPLEVSLVDNPCLPDATFSVVKVDGTTELRKFKEQVFSADEVLSFSAEWKEGVEIPPAFVRGIFKLQKILKAGDPLYAIVHDVKEADKVEPLIGKIAEIADNDGAQRVYVHKRLPGKQFRRKAELDEALIELDADEVAKKQAGPVLDVIAGLQHTLGKATGGDAGPTEKTVADPTKPAGDGLAKKEYSAEERKQGAKEGWAKKDGSYPIKTAEDVENAVKDWIRSKGSASDKRHIIKRAKALKATDKLPADWPGSTKKDDSQKAAGNGDLQKGVWLWDLSNMLGLLAQVEALEDVLDRKEWGPFVTLPDDLQARFSALSGEFGDIIAEMLDLVLATMKPEEAGDAVAAAARIGELQKLLAKAGAKHAKADKERIKQAHDLLVELDPDCCAAEEDEQDGDAEKLAKQLEAERVANGKLLNDTILPVIKDLAEKVDQVGKSVKTIAEQPLAMGTSSVNLRVVDKSNDGTNAGGSTEGLKELADRALAEARVGRTSA